MTYLIALVVAIALTAFILLSFNSSLNEQTLVKNQKKAELKTAVVSLNTLVRERLIYDFSLFDKPDWQDTLNNNYSKPYFLNDFSVSFDNFDDGFYACFFRENTNTNNIYYVAALELESTHQFIKVDSQCGDYENGLAIYIKQGV